MCFVDLKVDLNQRKKGGMDYNMGFNRNWQCAKEGIKSGGE